MSGPEIKTFEAPEVLKYVEKIQAAATPVFPKLASEKTSWAMAWIHLVIWNSWKSSYFYADKFPEDDFQHYSEYALLAAKFLIDHHEVEESDLFPVLEKKMGAESMSQNEAQHHAFLHQLEGIVEYIRSAQTEPAKFDAATYRAKVDEILAPIMQHLSDELDTLESSKLLKHFSEDEIDQINKAINKASRRGDNHKMLPFLLQNLPPNSPFPPAPGFVKNFLGPWVFYWRYSPLWKYTMYPMKPVLSASPQ